MKRKVLSVVMVLMVLAVSSFASGTLVYEANFNKTDSKKIDWVPFSGDWDIDGEFMVNADLSNGNTNIWQELDQYGDGTWTYEYKVTYDVKGGEWAPAAGFHFMVSDAEAPQRGDSYLVFQDLNEMQLYRCEAGGIVAVQRIPGFPAVVGKTSVVRVVYDTKSGLIEIFLNDVKVIEWIDDNPILDGQYISLRTNQTGASYDYVKVWFKK